MTDALERTYPLMLFLHILVVVVGFSAGTLIHFGLGRMRAADRADQALDGARIVGRLGPRMPLIGLALLLTGAGLTQARWTWSAAWVVVSIAGVVLMQGIGLAVLKPRVAVLVPRLAQAGSGRIEGDLIGGVRDPVLWTAAHIPPFLVIGIMFLMIQKPSLLGAVVTLVVAVAAAVIWAAPWRAVGTGVER